MFDEIRERTTTPPTPAKASLNRTLVYVLGAIAAILVIAAAILAYKIATTSNPAVPEHIKQSVDHPIFVPKKLPEGYKLVDWSLITDEGEKTVVFRAEDSLGSPIIFTEQKKPQNLNFEKFHQEEMRDTKELEGTPYPTILGKGPAGDRYVLSIVTDDTWIIVSTATRLSEQDFMLIAKSIKKY